MFSEQDKIKILKLKSSIASYYSLQIKKLGDRTLESLFYSNCVISGGMISSIFHDETIADIDLYPSSTKALITIKDHILSSNKNIKRVDNYELDSEGNKVPLGGSTVMITDNAVTLTNDIQFIYIDTWENCKKRFDFLHCLPHYDLATQKLYISKSQFDAISKKQLIPTGFTTPKEKRLDKYIKRGWSSSPTQSKLGESATGLIAQEVGPAFTSLYLNS